MMDVKLVVVGGKHAGQELQVPGPRFFIGRADDCHLRPQSEQISRHHAAILLESGYVAIRDLKSRNGTYVNGERIAEERELKNGDRVKVGPLEFELELAVSLSGRKRPKVHSVEEAAARTAESGSQTEMDIFNLLGEDAQPPNSTIADHPTVHAAQTTEISQQETDTVAGEQTKEGEKDEEKEKQQQQQQAKQEFLPKEPEKEQFADTGSAAAEVLKQFMKRK